MPDSVPEEALGPVRSVTGGWGSREAPRSSRRGPGARAEASGVRQALRRLRPAGGAPLARDRPRRLPVPPRVRAPARGVPRARRGGRGGALGALGGEQVRPSLRGPGRPARAPHARGRARRARARGRRPPGAGASPGEAGGRGPVGTGETSHEGGHEHAAVVAGHDRGRGRLCGEGPRQGAGGRPPRPARGGAGGRHRGRRRPTAPGW